MNKLNFLIGFNPINFPINLSGGMTVIKKLSETLTELGNNVYVLNLQYKNKNNHLISVSDINKLETERTVVIYPEITTGNPFNQKNVSRWVLYHTNQNVEETWGVNDEYFYFSDFFETFKTFDTKKILKCYDYHLDTLKNKNNNRKGYCHINKLNRPELDKNIVQKYNSEDLTLGFRTYGMEWLCDKMNEKEYFITYDNATFFSVAASLCGCNSVILYDGIKNENLKHKVESFKYGISYGFEEVEETKKTSHLLRGHLENIEKESIQSIKDFVSFWEKKLNHSNNE